MNFEFAYVVNVGSNLAHEHIGSACAAYSIIADEATDSDRSAWTIWVHGANVGVGFHNERHWDRFAAIFAEFTETARSHRSKADCAHRPAPARRRSRSAAKR